MEPFIAVCLIMIFALALLLLWREKIFESKALFAAAFAFTALALVIRASLLDYQSDDYLTFLAPWTQFFRDKGGFAALRYSLGNYNPPYMYFLALFSYSDISELYLIKLLSVVFDVLLAWACMKLLGLYTGSRAKLLGVFLAVLFLPTVVINGAYWAQCDSIYAFFGLFALYLGLRGRGCASMISLAACFAFKLQAVFIIPVFFILLLAKKIRWRELLVFPAAYIVFMLPALIAGRPFIETMTLYFAQAGTVGDAMNYNAPSLTSMFRWSGSTESRSILLIAAAFALVLASYVFAAVKRRALDDTVILGFALLLAMGIPYLLPHMHDRYFFISGVLALVLAFRDRRFFPVPLLAELASLHCYYAYFVRYYLVQPRIGGEFMLIALLLTAAYIIVHIRKIEKFKINP
ncbi:MAG: conjugal transfer protein TraL [Oscillospiraceae bacterium]|nr:conjugal transfer protein TraL [Oscillospiraceae bacterium]